MLAKQVKKLIFSNQYTFNEISRLTGESLEACISAFESYYNTPIPPSLLIVGNKTARKKIRNHIQSATPLLIFGNNGVGKDISLKQIAADLDLEIRKCVPIEQEQIIEAFDTAPFKLDNKLLFVIDVDSLKKKKYKILKKYITHFMRPMVLLATSKDAVNKRILKEVETVKLVEPSMFEVEDFLKKKYNWNGEIHDIYDPDMRVVIARVLNEIKDGSVFGEKGDKKKEIKSNVLAFDISCGYARLSDFENCKEPFWWILRWLAFNQYQKFPNNKKIQLENLAKLSEIDLNKFVYDENYLRSMLLDIEVSPRRARFSFPPWPKKIKEKEEEIVEKLDKPKNKPKPKPKIEKKLQQVDFSKWL